MEELATVELRIEELQETSRRRQEMETELDVWRNKSDLLEQNWRHTGSEKAAQEWSRVELAAENSRRRRRGQSAITIEEYDSEEYNRQCEQNSSLDGKCFQTEIRDGKLHLTILDS